MTYWLMKSEPETWSWEDHLSCPDQTEPWDGVRNHQAAKNMRAMEVGDLVFFYHSGKAREIVGIMEVVKTAYADLSDPKGKFVKVDVKARTSFSMPVTLKQIKAEESLLHLPLVRQPRLSVMPIDPESWDILCTMGGL